MSKDDLVYVGHMLDMARKGSAKVTGLSRQQFDQDENLQLALAHLIQVIGEAARLVSDAFQQAHPQIPWKPIIGMRHRVVHDYLQVDFDIIWDVATVHLASLIDDLEKIVPGKIP